MKKTLFALAFFLLPASLSFCESAFHFSFAPRFSLTLGELNEILYDSYDDIKSQLDWEQKPLVNIGLEASANYRNIIFSAAFDYSTPAGTSYMYDSDWDGGQKYSFTKHPMTSAKNIYTEAALAYEIKTPVKLSVIPELQFNYIYSDFEAGRGSGIRSGREIKVYGIDYNRHSFFIFAGLSVKAQITPAFILKTAFFTAPWNYHKCFDYHHGVKHPFSTLEFQSGHFTKYKIKVSTQFIADKNLSIELFSDIIFGLPDKGIFYTDYYSTSMEKITTQKSGSAIHTLKLGTSVKFHF